jgi:hypothetical protein
MSTRGLVGVVSDGKLFTTYNHFDSYPDGLGQKVVEFTDNLFQNIEVDKLREQFSKVKVVAGDSAPSEEDKKFYAKGADLSVSNQSLNDWYCLLRGFQGVNTFEAVLKGKLKHILDASDFAKDSLFCEWGYILDLDKCNLEVYKGFQTKAHKKGRFAAPKPKGWKPRYEGDNFYYPIKLVLTIPFDKINNHSLDCLMEKDEEVA